MFTVPLQAIPNQSMFLTIDDNQWEIVLRTTNGTVSASLSRNGVEILSNTPVVAGMRIIPYRYLESGNFALITQLEEVADYTKFGVTQFLLYISQAEIDAARADKPVLFTANTFDPNGGLPLRFKPKGYVLA